MDRIYDAYNGEGLSSDFTRKTRDRLHWICSKVTGSCVLDVGCSQGIGPILLGRSGFKVLGLDINPEAISFAEGVLSKELPTVQESVRFACVNFAQYPEDGEKFDTVIFGEVLEHLPRPDKFIEKAVALLSPGGHIVVTVPFGINDDPDHRQTFYYSRINQYLYPNFEILEVRYFGHWIGFVGKKRDVAVATPTQVDYSVLEILEDTVFKIERSLRDQLIAQRTKIRQGDEKLAQLSALRDDVNRKCAALTAAHDEAERKCAALTVDLANQKGALARTSTRLKTVESRYEKLAKAKLGRLTLAYWRLKDACKSRLRSFHFPRLAKAVEHSQRLVEPDGDFAYDVSVVIPTYRPNSSIDRAIDSVLRQSLQGRIQVLVCVNGGDEAYSRDLRKRYSAVRNVMVLLTAEKGVNAGRNLGIKAAKGRYLAFLDDDDYWTPGYLKTLIPYFDQSQVSVVIGRLVDENSTSGERNEETYINKTLKKFGSVCTDDYLRLASFFSSFCMKVYRTATFKKLGALPTGNDHTEDVLFWAERFDRLEGKIALAAASSSEAYIRRTTAGSLSRPIESNRYAFFVTDRLAILDQLKDFVLHVAKNEKHRLFILNKINAQTTTMLRYVDSLPEDRAKVARDEIRTHENIFLNKSLFAKRTAIAFCHNFAPYVDASAFVATKRLHEIAKLEASLLGWTVISQDMTRIREKDLTFQRYYADFAYSNRIELDKPTGFAPKAQLPYVGAALAEAEKLPQAEVIYSRALFAGSHMAAYEYKKCHPQAKWYAEFSDPLTMGVDDKPRACLEKPDWSDVEQMVYELADVILFTNRNQIDYMLSYNPNPSLNDSIRARAVVRHHPVISSDYRLISPCSYDLDASKINVGYFGTFYVTRKAEDLLNLLQNQAIVLHIFTTKPESLQELVARYKNQIRVNPVVSQFEFMNLGARMDYLVLADTEFPGAINPFLPSKYADYLVTGTRIIAKVQHGSVLATEDNLQLIKVGEVTRDFAVGLGKQRT